MAKHVSKLATMAVHPMGKFQIRALQISSALDEHLGPSIQRLLKLYDICLQS